MKCSPKTMLKMGGVLAVLLAGGYFVFPQFSHALIGLAPFALFALCPLAMMFGMKGMSNESGAKDGGQNALATLADQYAKGEISKEEFESKKKTCAATFFNLRNW